MRKIQYLFIGLFFCLGIQAQEKFNIRGVLPWHNFLSGPTSWNLSDYRNYLDECQKMVSTSLVSTIIRGVVSVMPLMWNL